MNVGVLEAVFSILTDRLRAVSSVGLWNHPRCQVQSLSKLLISFVTSGKLLSPCFCLKGCGEDWLTHSG